MSLKDREDKDIKWRCDFQPDKAQTTSLGKKNMEV